MLGGGTTVVQSEDVGKNTASEQSNIRVKAKSSAVSCTQSSRTDIGHEYPISRLGPRSRGFGAGFWPITAPIGFME